MKKLSIASILIFAFAGAQSASAAVNSVLIHGNNCFNATPGGGALNYSQWGPYNPSNNTALTVHCPVVLPNQGYHTIFYHVTGWSRNSGANKLSCTLSMTAINGNSHASSTATVPYNPGAPTSGNTSTFAAGAFAGWPYLACYIPPQNGNGMSYLSSINVQASY